MSAGIGAARHRAMQVVCIFCAVGLSRSFAQTVYFESTAETGDLSEWVGDGGGHVFSAGEDWLSLRTRNVHASSDRARTGKYSIRCHLPDPAAAQDAKLYRERAGDQQEAYYSAWFWFDPAFKPSQWVNIFQFKTKMGTFPPLCDPTFVIMLFHRNDARRLVLYHWPVGQKLLPPGPGDVAHGSHEQQRPKHVPDSTWVHIEVFYRIDRVNGEIIVWQDGDEIFHVTNVNSQDARTSHPNDPGTLLFGPGIYSSSGNKDPLLLYVDDVKVSSAPSRR